MVMLIISGAKCHRVDGGLGQNFYSSKLLNSEWQAFLGLSKNHDLRGNYP